MNVLLMLVATAAAETCETIESYDECIDLVGGVAYTAWSEDGDYRSDEQLFSWILDQPFERVVEAIEPATSQVKFPLEIDLRHTDQQVGGVVACDARWFDTATAADLAGLVSDVVGGTVRSAATS